MDSEPTIYYYCQLKFVELHLKSLPNILIKIAYSLLFFTLIFINITKKNWIYIFILFVYSTFQYGIFWGISLTDILFFFFLFNSKKVTSFYDENELITQKEIKD